MVWLHPYATAKYFAAMSFAFIRESTRILQKDWGFGRLAEALDSEYALRVGHCDNPAPGDQAG